MSEAYTVALPTKDEPVQVLGIYHSVMSALGLELGKRYDEYCKPRLGDDWFLKLKAQHQMGHKPPISLFDPSFVLNEPLHNPSSPLRDCLPKSAALFNQLDEVVQVRNVWSHYSAEQTLSELENALRPVHKLATMAQMRLGGPVSAIRKRIKAILNGDFPPTSTPEPAGDPEPPTAVESGTDAPIEVLETIEREREAFVAAAPARPPIGSLWLGEVPRRRARFSATGDLLQAETGVSLKPEMTDAASKLPRWAALRPMGDLRVADDDGAVAAYLSGELRLIGYLGDEPPFSGARGFVLPHLYEKQRGDVVDRDSGRRLTAATTSAASVLARLGSVLDGTALRLTTEGDVAVFDEEGATKICSVTAAEWFPGHLAG